ncbi:hypothetical protein, partial [Vibrio cholerae]|uniref:hypothetical protein n=1 Tax=Vibrio cholerae TaxID=666 RepID=UPI0039C937F4
SRFRWLPTPFRSLFLFIVWLLLNNSVSVGHIVLATFFAIFIPILSFSFRDQFNKVSALLPKELFSCL